MNQKPIPQKSSFLARIGNQYGGALTPIALSALSAWLIVTGVKGLAGFTLTQQSMLADLIGILVVIVAARWMNARKDSN
ncbi:MAG: hypothetical protein V4695_02860 [Pseudomonadota bacterium]